MKLCTSIVFAEIFRTVCHRNPKRSGAGIVFCNHDQQLKGSRIVLGWWFRLWDCECKTSEHLVLKSVVLLRRKDTGGGRESGSDAVYMRRQTNTINYVYLCHRE
jgi:hypothetical protein